jgi:hypothetical protein
MVPVSRYYTTLLASDALALLSGQDHEPRLPGSVTVDLSLDHDPGCDPLAPDVQFSPQITPTAGHRSSPIDNV